MGLDGHPAEVAPGSPMGVEEPELADAVAAAEAGDTAARRILERLGGRLARICAVLASLLDVERIVVCGAIAATAWPVIERAGDRLAARALLPPPQVVSSTLGADVVTVGAVRRALAIVRSSPLANRPGRG